MGARGAPDARRAGGPSRGLIFLAFLLLLLGLGSPSASAHAYLMSSNPPDGATLESGPAELRLGFSEHVVLGATRISVVDGAGHHVPVTGVRIVTEDPADTEEPAEIVGRLPVLHHGSYRVTWQTLSSDDLHRTSGLLVFGVGTKVDAAARQESPPAPDQAGLDALLLLGLAAALGAPLGRRVLAPIPGSVDVRRALTVLGRTGALLALATALLFPLLEGIADAGLGIMTTGSYGLRWSVREVGLALLLTHHLRPPRRHRRAFLVAGAGLAAVGHALLGHAAAGSGWDPVRVGATAAHLLAALAWAGSVGCLAVALLTARFRAGLPVVPVRSALRQFAVPAAGCVSVAAVTGVYLASDVVVSLDSVVDTIYGRSLLLKLALASAVAVLACVNHRRLRGPRDLDVPLRTVLAEAVGLVLVLGATAFLVSGQPANQDRLVDAGPSPTHGQIARDVGALAETVKVRPNRPGAAVVLVDVFDTRRPAPGQVSAVSVRLGRGTPALATPLGDGHWSLAVPELAPGPLPVRVTVTESGAVPVTSHYDWVVGPAADTPAVHLSRAPISSALRAGSVVLGLLLAMGWSVAIRRSRRGRSPRPVPTREETVFGVEAGDAEVGGRVP